MPLEAANGFVISSPGKRYIRRSAAKEIQEREQIVWSDISTRRVILVGLLIDLVLNVLGGIGNSTLLRGAWREAVPHTPVSALSTSQLIFGTAMATVSDFIFAIAFCWVYVAIQPRYGPGISTATRAAVLIWIVGVVVFYIAEVSSGTTPLGLSVATTTWALVTFVPAVWIARELLTEAKETA
ncbi:MAG: hypothetical protein DMG05_09110 [Acidobacteria bacterium]|nr:MAG: hypothetical protein DMG05_09110 [Acidobacteriota bacterium]